jgi:hypothetical protein
MSDALAGPESQTQARLKLDEHNSPVLELFANDAFGGKAQAITVETQRGFKIINAESDNCDSRFHMTWLP